MYEGGIRTPLLVKWPGKVAPGSYSDHISAFWDFMPTFAEITGIPVPEKTDGISFLPTLLGKTARQKEHEYLYWEFHEQGGKVAIRMGDWKAVKLDMDRQPQGATELYKLTEDIGETNNVADANPDILRNMEEIMKKAHLPSDIFPFSFESATR